MQKKITIEEIRQKIFNLQFNEDFDLVVAIARGGIIPGALVNQKLDKDFEIITIRFKDENKKPIFNEPKLLKKINFNFVGKKILLVDDRIKTGATMKKAKELLNKAKIVKTFVINGNADYFLFNEECFPFPWE